jgi:hypothetical protein
MAQDAAPRDIDARVASHADKSCKKIQNERQWPNQPENDPRMATLQASIRSPSIRRCDFKIRWMLAGDTPISSAISRIVALPG